MIKVRDCVPDDAERLVEIYAPYVRDTAVSFEYEVPSVEEFKIRIERTLASYPYIVAEEDGVVQGYAYAGVFHEREAYNHCVETSIYVSQGQRGKGVGRVLYDELEKRLTRRGIINLNACISWKDEEDEYLTHDSQLFHERLGYVRVAHFHRCGYKFGRWYDMIWMEKLLDVNFAVRQAD